MRDAYRDGREYTRPYLGVPFSSVPAPSRPPASVHMAAGDPEMLRLSEELRRRGGRSTFVMWKGHKPATPMPYYAIRNDIANCIADTPEAVIAAMREAISNWFCPFRDMIALARDMDFARVDRRP